MGLRCPKQGDTPYSDTQHPTSGFCWPVMPCLVLLTVLLSGNSRADSGPLRLTYGEVVERAKRFDRAGQRAELESDRAALNATEAEKTSSPTANVTAALTGRLQPEGGTSSGRRGTAWSAEPLGTIVPEQSLRFGVSLPIYDGGAARAARSAARASREAAEGQRAEADADLAHRVALLCARYLGWAAINEISTLQLKSAETRFATLRAAYARGERSELELTRAELELGRARIARDRADGEQLLLEYEVRELIGTDTSGTPHLPTSGTERAAPQRLQLELSRRPLADWMAFWTTLRGQPTSPPGHARREAARRATFASLQSIEAKAAPHVQLQGGVGLGGSLSPLRPLGQAELQFVYPLGWNRTTNEERERLFLDLRDIAEEEKQDTLTREHARRRLEETIGQRERERAARTAQLAVLERFRRLTQRRYDSGKASALELAEAEDQLLAARVEGAHLDEQIMMHVIHYSTAVGAGDYAQLFEQGEKRP